MVLMLCLKHEINQLEIEFGNISEVSVQVLSRTKNSTNWSTG